MTTPQQAIEKEAALTHYSDMARVARLEAVNAELVAALQGVIRVADRATQEFDAARAALEKAGVK